jgi:selenocysteine lyase/cysteine desulfurase
LVVFQSLIKHYKNRPLKIASVTACSNVTGIETPYHDIAKIMHQVGGYCFVDFACSGPYRKIDMHPETDPAQQLDAIFLSPHKFLGGPGTSGIVMFNAKLLYKNKVPDNPGGGTVVFTSPWDVREYATDIETREDGGTPPFLQVIRTGMAVRLKEQMGIEHMHTRETTLVKLLMNGLNKIKGVQVLASNQRNRLAVVSFCVEFLHYNLAVRLLNDRFGIQARGGCACAGTYGHILLNINKVESESIRQAAVNRDFSIRRGWVRVSLHPIMQDEEVHRIIYAVDQIVIHKDVWSLDYLYNQATNEYDHVTHPTNKLQNQVVRGWFDRPYTSKSVWNDSSSYTESTTNFDSSICDGSDSELVHEF